MYIVLYVSSHRPVLLCQERHKPSRAFNSDRLLGKTKAVIWITQTILFQRVVFFYEIIFFEWFAGEERNGQILTADFFLVETIPQLTSLRADIYCICHRELQLGPTSLESTKRCLLFYHFRFPQRNNLLNLYFSYLLLLYLQFLIAFTVYLTVLKQTVHGGPSNSSQTNQTTQFHLISAGENGTSAFAALGSLAKAVPELIFFSPVTCNNHQ